MHQFAQSEALGTASAHKSDVVGAVAHHCAGGFESPCAFARCQIYGFPLSHEGAILLVSRKIGRKVERQRIVTAVNLGDGAEVGLALHSHRLGVDGRMAVRIRAVGGVANGGSLYRRRQFEAHLVAHLGNFHDFGLRHAVVAAFVVQSGILLAQTLLEALPTASGIAAPTQFGHSQQARETEIFGIIFRTVFVEWRQFLQYGAVYKLVAPEAALHAQYGRCRRIVVDGHRVALLERDGRHPGGSLYFARSLAFGEVEIEVGGRREYCFVSGVAGFDGVGHFVPYHSHHRLAHLAAHYYFFPSHHGFAFGFHHIRHHIGEIALKVGCLLDAFTLHHFAAKRAFVPAVVDGFIAADIDVLRREQVYSLFEHIGEEFIRRFLAHAQQVATDKVLTGHFVLLARARQPRISHHCREHVGGEFNLGDNLHIAHCGIGYDFAYIVLRIVATEAILVLACPSTHLGEARIFLYFEAPTGVVDEVELQLVHLVHCHHVDVMLHKFLVEEIASHIEHHTSPRAVGGIADAHIRHLPSHIGLQSLAVNGRWQELQQSLYAIEQSAIVVSADGDAAAVYGQVIAFGGSYAASVNLKHHIGTTFFLGCAPIVGCGAQNGFT